jgi:transposase
VSKIRSRSRKPQKPPHCPLKLDEAQEKSVLQFLQDGFTSGKYVTQREFLSFVEEHFQKTVTYGWLASFLELWESIVIRTTVVLQEQPRRRILREYLND